MLPPPGTSYFSKAGEVVDITGWVKLFLICVAVLKSLGGFDKVGCTSKRTLAFLFWKVEHLGGAHREATGAIYRGDPKRGSGRLSSKTERSSIVGEGAVELLRTLRPNHAKRRTLKVAILYAQAC